MTLKQFVHYNSETGAIDSITFEDEIFINQRLTQGETLLEITEKFDINLYKVDLQTRKIIPISPSGTASGQALVFAISE